MRAHKFDVLDTENQDLKIKLKASHKFQQDIGQANNDHDSALDIANMRGYQQMKNLLVESYKNIIR